MRTGNDIDLRDTFGSVYFRVWDGIRANRGRNRGHQQTTELISGIEGLRARRVELVDFEDVMMTAGAVRNLYVDLATDRVLASVRGVGSNDVANMNLGL
jgi:hypothetical protein